MRLGMLVVVERHGMAVLQVGSWPAPFGITLAADLLSTLMLALAGVMAIVVVVFALAETSPGDRSPAFFPLLFVLLLGVHGALLTGDLFNLYVWFEVLLISSFGLVGLGGQRSAAEGAVKAMTINLVGSMLFLLAAGVTYGITGTLNMAELHERIAALQQTHPASVNAVGMTLAVAFAIKAALFPLYFWLPASYHVPSAATCAIFAALLTKVGLYSLVRVFTLPFAGLELVYIVVLVLTTITMVSGVLGAVTQFEIKRILAWHSVSQVGYIAVGFGLLTSDTLELRVLGLAAAVYFILHHGLIKPALFLIAPSWPCSFCWQP